MKRTKLWKKRPKEIDVGAGLFVCAYIFYMCFVDCSNLNVLILITRKWIFSRQSSFTVRKRREGTVLRITMEWVINVSLSSPREFLWKNPNRPKTSNCKFKAPPKTFAQYLTRHGGVSNRSGRIDVFDKRSFDCCFQ